MTEQWQPPSLEKVKQRAAKMQEINKRWDAHILVLDDMIAELEAEIRQQLPYRHRLEKAKRLLNLHEEKSETVEIPS